MNVEVVLERDCLVDLSMNGGRILKHVLHRTGFTWLIQASVPLFCYCTNKSLQLLLYLEPVLSFLLMSGTTETALRADKHHHRQHCDKVTSPNKMSITPNAVNINRLLQQRAAIRVAIKTATHRSTCSSALFSPGIYMLK